MIYLASSSKRRFDILKTTGIDFKLIRLNKFCENLKPCKPANYVMKLAKFKYNYVKLSPEINGYVCTFDTIVYFNDMIIGKPRNNKEAVKMLLSYKNQNQLVYTGFCISKIKKGELQKQIVSYEKTKLFFANYTKEDVSLYLSKFNTLDKAGGYGIQDGGAIFIKKIDGCYYNVVGLPIFKFISTLKNF
jgi:septum formation protein